MLLACLEVAACSRARRRQRRGVMMRAMAGMSDFYDVAAVAHPLDALNINNTVLRFLHQVADCEACWFSAMDELRVARGGHDAQLASCCPMAPPALATCICIFATLASCCCNQHARCMHAGQCKAARTSNRALRAARRGLRGHLNVLERLQSPPREGHLARARRGHPTAWPACMHFRVALRR